MRRFFLVLLVLALGGTCACALIPRYPAVERAVRPRPGEVYGLDPWLLAEGLADRTIVEIDWVEGCKPAPRTVEGLRKVLIEYSPPGRSVEISLDDEIPRAVWDEQPQSRGELHPLIARYADEAWVGRESSMDAARRYVLFAPAVQPGYFGFSSSWPMKRGETAGLVQGVVVFRDPRRNYEKLVIRRDQLERMTLIHEFGHQLGLVRNPAHERMGVHGAHCTSLNCLMAHPTPRVFLRNAWRAITRTFLDEYCKLCQADMREAQAVWRRRMADDPGYVERLRKQRLTELRVYEIGALARAGEHERVLSEIEAALAAGGDERTYAETQVRALLALGRMEEALSLLRSTGGNDLIHARCSVGRALIADGRHEEAAALFGGDVMARAWGAQFEEATRVLRMALDGLGRFEESAAAAGELWARGHALTFAPADAMLGAQITSLRRAGQPEAALELCKEARSKKARSRLALEEARSLDLVGRSDDARVLRRKFSKKVERDLRDAESDAIRRWFLQQLAWVRAEQGLRSEALELLEASRALPPPERSSMSFDGAGLLYAMLGEYDRAAAFLHEQTREQRQYFDPCGVEAFAPMVADPRYADVLGHCPLAPHAR